MITKHGESLVKEAILDAAVGLYRANNLSKGERELLEKEYGLPENANLCLRNAGRGAVGSILGGMAGGVVGNALSGGNKRFGAISGLAGTLMGVKLMTDKYSRGNAERVRERNMRSTPVRNDIDRQSAEYRLDGNALRGLIEYYRNNPGA